MEQELGLTALFNENLAGLGGAILGLFHIHPENAARPWENWLVMELLVIALLMITVAILRSSLSVEKPGTLQHLFESIYGFINSTIEQVGIHHGHQYAPYIATVFITILSFNLIGIIPDRKSTRLNSSH